MRLVRRTIRSGIGRRYIVVVRVVRARRKIRSGVQIKSPAVAGRRAVPFDVDPRRRNPADRSRRPFQGPRTTDRQVQIEPRASIHRTPKMDVQRWPEFKGCFEVRHSGPSGCGRAPHRRSSTCADIHFRKFLCNEQAAHTIIVGTKEAPAVSDVRHGNRIDRIRIGSWVGCERDGAHAEAEFPQRLRSNVRLRQNGTAIRESRRDDD